MKLQGKLEAAVYFEFLVLCANIRKLHETDIHTLSFKSINISHHQTLLWYDWKIVESDVKPEQTII